MSLCSHQLLLSVLGCVRRIIRNRRQVFTGFTGLHVLDGVHGINGMQHLTPTATFMLMKQMRD